MAAQRWKDEVAGASGFNALLGLWLVFSPFILGYAPGDAVWNPVVFGAIVMVLAGVRVFAPRQSWLSLINAGIGAWLFSTAFWLAESDQAFWNTLLSGAAVFVLALVSATATREGKTGEGAGSGEEAPAPDASGSPYVAPGDHARPSDASAGATIAVFVAVALLVWIAFAAFDYDDDFDAGVTVEDVADNTARVEGRTVTVAGEVEEVRPGAFLLEGARGNEIVVTTRRSNLVLVEGEFVQVTGIVRDEDDIDTRGLDGDGAVVATFLDPEPLT
jgi:hypothetical protein